MSLEVMIKRSRRSFCPVSDDQVHQDRCTSSHRNRVRLGMPRKCWRGVVAGSKVSQMILPSSLLPCLRGNVAEFQDEEDGATDSSSGSRPLDIIVD